MGADARNYAALVLVGEGRGVLGGAEEEDGVPALYSTYAHVISGLLKLGYSSHAQAVKFLMSYGERDLGLDTESFGLLARCLIHWNRLLMKLWRF